jgi:hypothetical protein
MTAGVCHVCHQPLVPGANFCGQCGVAVRRETVADPSTGTGTRPGGGHPAGWYPDYADRSRLRYFDGTAWTQHVSRDGRTWEDVSG